MRFDVSLLPALAGGVRALAPQGKLYDWRLEVMGAMSELQKKDNRQCGCITLYQEHLSLHKSAPLFPSSPPPPDELPDPSMVPPLTVMSSRSLWSMSFARPLRLWAISYMEMLQHAH